MQQDAAKGNPFTKNAQPLGNELDRQNTNSLLDEVSTPAHSLNNTS